MKQKINYKKVKRNILIVIFILAIIKYFCLTNDKTQKSLAIYQDFVNYAERNNLTITQENYQDFTNNK